VQNIMPQRRVSAGHHEQRFALPQLKSGTYFYRLTTSSGLVRSHMIQVQD